MSRRGAAWLVIATCAACAPAVDGAPDAGPGDVVHVDPSAFDCSSLGPNGDRLPARASPVPVACALDPSCRTRQVSAHRGAGGQLGLIAPEDTLSAYRAGIAVGVDFVETDPRPTSDGVLVNIHDPTVDRTTDGTGEVAAMTFDEVRALHIKDKGLPGDFSCDKVPTLEEILQTCRERVVVLVDANKTDDVAGLVQAIEDADAVDWAIFDTSSVDKIDAALALEPNLHFMNRPDTVAAVGTELDHFAPRLPALVELHLDELDEGLAVVHDRGTRVLTDVFTIDVLANLGGDADYNPVLDQGLDVPQSDRPDLVLEALRIRGER